jgi:DEAD/DEAH box helicase domain-containing protein
MIEDALSRWRRPGVSRHISCHEILEAQSAQIRPFPDWVDDKLVKALKQRGIEQLYEHQWQAAEATRRDEDLVIATPTASGKSLCYTLPVFSDLLADPHARALYLFPTKALARDQVHEARKLAAATGDTIGVAVYDGDTPPDERRAARRRARILATNPEMLHGGILPHHPSWAELLSGLRYVVVDELHTYRGVFGSHLANVLRRLQRVAAFHGSRPRFIATSATIANPAELAGQLFGRPARLIDQSGAPRGERHFLIYNPPLIDRALGIRENYLRAAGKLTRDLAAAQVSTLVFCRSRLAVEVMVRQLRDTLASVRGRGEGGAPTRPERVRGYRGGYLPDRRREVERDLREGNTDVVVATSALELGIDVGGLDAVVLAGWPGSRAAAWQRAGRAGRRLAPSLAVLVASSEPVDQYVAAEPGYLFGQAPEHARVNPDNASILVPHLKCGAYELPFTHGERYGALSVEETDEVLGCLADAEVIHRSPAGYHYMGHPYPASEVHLRGPMEENFLVVERPVDQIIAEVDFKDAPQVLHDDAIYQLEGHQYQVLGLDHDNHKAFVARIAVDYFTDAMTHTRVRILERTSPTTGVACCGEVHVVNRVVGFKKIKLHTGENVGYGEVNQPERQMHSTALWLNPPAAPLSRLDRSPAELAEATLAAAYTLHSAAALILMSDARDLGRAVGDARSGWFAVSGRVSRGGYSIPDDGQPVDGLAPTIFLFDRYPGGMGLAERLFDLRGDLLRRARAMVRRCACERGCPACIGPGSTAEAKVLAAEVLGVMLGVLDEERADLGQHPRPGGASALQQVSA